MNITLSKEEKEKLYNMGYTWIEIRRRKEILEDNIMEDILSMG